MENITEYIDVLIQAPIAVILIVFIYLTFKFLTALMHKQMEVISKIIQALNEAIKIVKQEKRK